MKTIILLALVVVVSAGIFDPLVEKKCEICKDIMKKTVDDAGDNIAERVKEICKTLTIDILDNFCEKLIADSVETIIDGITKHIPAEEICKNIGLC
uniref:Saposin B-type domain-containing protein n=1 Tax=Panagrolaimus sp. JU765 TaxID=591449 RepID=A0AC34QID3_9BILA